MRHFGLSPVKLAARLSAGHRCPSRFLGRRSTGPPTQQSPLSVPHEPRQTVGVLLGARCSELWRFATRGSGDGPIPATSRASPIELSAVPAGRGVSWR
jgi:hypothetical protein